MRPTHAVGGADVAHQRGISPGQLGMAEENQGCFPQEDGVLFEGSEATRHGDQGCSGA